MKMCKEVIAKVLPGMGSLQVFDSENVGTFVSFLFFYILSSYYFLQCIGSIYWKNHNGK